MLIKKLKLNYFGRFQNHEIELKPGINLIYGENEAGKSTIHTFIKGMLFGIERLRGRGASSKEDTYTRYLPWDYPGAFSGSMDIQVGEKEYRLQRSFHANDKNFTIVDLSTGREVKLKEGLISEIVPGLTESAFKNTISIEQLKARTDSDLAEQVQNYITNLSIAKSKEVNVAQVVSRLTDQRKQLEPTQKLLELKALQVEIENGTRQEAKIDQLTIQLKELQLEEQKLVEQRKQSVVTLEDEETQRMEQLPAILEKYRSYQELLKQVESSEQQERELQIRIDYWEKEQLSAGTLKEEIQEIGQIKIFLAQLEHQQFQLQSEKATCLISGRRKLVIWTASLLLIALVSAVGTGFNLFGLGIAGLLVLSAIVMCVSITKINRKNLLNIVNKEQEVNNQRETAATRLEVIVKKHHITDVEALSQKQEELLKNFYALEHTRQQQKELEKQLQDNEDKKDLLYETIMKYMQYFMREDELTPLSIQKLQEVIHLRRQETQEKQVELNNQYDNCKINLERLRWEITTMESNEDQLLKNKERYSELEQSLEENTVELEAIKLALSTIQELSVDIHDSFGQRLNQAVSEVIRDVTGDKYKDLKLDEKLEVRVGWNGDYVLLDRLSAGTIDQVYFSLRLAVADLLLGKDEVPLILDDSFALYDEARVRATLVRIAKRKQIIMFTCHKREQSLLKELGLPYHIVDLTRHSLDRYKVSPRL